MSIRLGLSRLIAAALLALTLAVPARAGWDGYRVIMWQDNGPAARRALPALGVDAGLIYGMRGQFDARKLRAEADAFSRLGLALYVENIATDFYAPYHRWHPHHKVTWLFDTTKAAFRHDPANPANFYRAPGLSDPVWQARIDARLAEHVGALVGEPVLYFNLGDETGIADLTAAWDFDLAPDSLAAMRVWLRGQYGSLAALNRAWGSDFATWGAVVPDTTDTVLRCTDGHFAAWVDFKAWMDIAFARAVRRGTEAVHAADPHALAGLEGGQVPGWSGYDYSLLAPAVDLMELGLAGEALSLARAFHPGIVPLVTSFGDGPREVNRLWRAALLGARGTVIWDDSYSFQRKDGGPAPRARTFAPLFAALHGSVGRTLIAATPLPGPVAVLYSMPSFRVAWLRDRQAALRATGADWAARDAETEDEDSPWRASFVAAAESLRHLGMPPRFLSPAMLAVDDLPALGVRALLLPHAVALSAAEITAIRTFAAHGGLVFADIPPGAFDAHGTRRTSLPLGKSVHLLPRFTEASLAAPLAAAGVDAAFPLTATDGAPPADVTTYTYRLGGRVLVALQRAMPATGAPPPPETVTLALPGAQPVRTLLGAAPSDMQGNRLTLSLDAVTPTLLAIGPD